MSHFQDYIQTRGVNLNEAFDSDPYPFQLDPKSNSMDRFYTFADDKGTVYRVWFEKRQNLGKKVTRVIIGQNTNGRVFKKVIQRFQDPLRVLGTILAIFKEALVNDNFVKMQDGFTLGLPKNMPQNISRFAQRMIKRALMGTQFDTAENINFNDDEFDYLAVKRKGRNEAQVFDGRLAELQAVSKVPADSNVPSKPDTMVVDWLKVFQNAPARQTALEMAQSSSKRSWKYVGDAQSGHIVMEGILAPGDSYAISIEYVHSQHIGMIEFKGRYNINLKLNGNNASVPNVFTVPRALKTNNLKDAFTKFYTEDDTFDAKLMQMHGLDLSEMLRLAKEQWRLSINTTPTKDTSLKSKIDWYQSKFGRFGVAQRGAVLSPEQWNVLKPAKVKALETDDYQKRGGNYPRSGVPDDIKTFEPDQTGKMTLRYSFKDFASDANKAWAVRHAQANLPGVKIVKSEVYDAGDYQGDWANVDISIDLEGIPEK